MTIRYSTILEKNLESMISLLKSLNKSDYKWCQSSKMYKTLDLLLLTYFKYRNLSVNF